MEYMIRDPNAVYVCCTSRTSFSGLWRKRVMVVTTISHGHISQQLAKGKNNLALQSISEPEEED